MRQIEYTNFADNTGCVRFDVSGGGGNDALRLFGSRLHVDTHSVCSLDASSLRAAVALQGWT